MHGRRIPTPPGEILLKEFLNPNRISQTNFAKALGVKVQYVNNIIKGRRKITTKYALMFAKCLGTSPQFWLNLQNNYDLAIDVGNYKSQISLVVELTNIRRLPEILHERT